MPIVSDKGNWKSQLNSKIGPFVAKVFGQRAYYILRYYSHRHRLPNLKHPQDLSERILSAMMSKDFLKYADYADKVKVREYIKAKGLGDILLTQYGAWPDASQIPFDKLPEKFILKANNGSGGHYICIDKSQMDIEEVVRNMNETLAAVKDFKKTEPHYGAIKPMILAEELMGDGITLPVDYKFMCINGKIGDILVASERDKGAKYCRVSEDWKLLPYTNAEYMPDSIPPRPEHLKEMIEIAKVLSADFECVRVDLYDFNGKVYFGELTFSPLGGILSSYTDEGIKALGKMFNK